MISEKHFVDWENSVFGYGYGTGEVHTLRALQQFLDLCHPDTNTFDMYHYGELEKEMGEQVAWLMINILCCADLIEYGTSSRNGWLTQKGAMVKAFVVDRSIDRLYDLVSVDSNYVHCYPDHCNCDTPCNNPLFQR